jgi:glycosyltransferase involved in cell wall biosynthesis
MHAESLIVLCDTAGRDGGTETYLERVLPGLARGGTRVTLLARRVLADADVFGVPAREIAWGNEEEEPRPAAAVAVAKIIAEVRPDALLASNVFDETVLRAARDARRLIVQVHDHRPFCPNGDRRYRQFPGNCHQRMGAACAVNTLLRGCIVGPRSASLQLLRQRMRVRDTLRAADAILVSSAFMAASCVANGLDEARIRVIPPPLARDDYVAQPLPMPRACRLFFAGRILPQKGLPSLVRAVGRIPAQRRPTLAVAGRETPEYLHALEVARRAGVSIDYLGVLEPSRMRNAIDASRAVAMPSLWDEPFGLVGIEGQARGRAAVAYDVGGIREWLGSAGIAVPVGDEAALARAIEEVTAELTWQGYADQAFARSKLFHPDTHFSKLQEVLCES